MSIGANLKRFRMDRGLSQKQVADAVGVSQSMIAQIERGTKSMTIELGSDIALVLGIQIGQLLEDNERVLPQLAGRG